jgi:hypothetical protein
MILSAAGSADPGNDIGSYVWDLDGDGQYDGASGVTAGFSRVLDGKYTVRVKVTDDDGAYDTDTATVTVNNVTPRADVSGPYTMNEHNSIILSAAWSYDAYGSIVSYA